MPHRTFRFQPKPDNEPEIVIKLFQGISGVYAHIKDPGDNLTEVFVDGYGDLLLGREATS